MFELTNNQKTLIEGAQIERFQRGGVRFWGTEFEHPEAGNLAYILRQDNVEIYKADTDPTVPTTFKTNVCECSECDHSCDCSFCHRSSGRCNYVQTNEVAISPQRVRYHDGIAKFITELGNHKLSDYKQFVCYDCEQTLDESYCYDCEQSVDESDPENIGFHTHIDARDLTVRQAGSVVRLAQSVIGKFGDAFGADEDGYNYKMTDRDIDEIQTGTTFGNRQTWVNPSGLLRHLSDFPNEADRPDPTGAPNPRFKATIEFRVFRYTPNAELHLARVAFARAVVDYVASGKPIFWLMREPDFAKVLAELDIQNH